MAVEGGVGAGRVELDRGETLLDIFERAGGGEVRDRCRRSCRRRILRMDAAGVRVEVGVGAQRLVHLPAEQLVDRLVGFLADDVPAGHFERRKAAHAGDVGPLGEAGGITAAEEGLDVVRVAANQIALGHVLDHAGGDMGREGRVVGFAVADHAAVGGELDEDEILAADAGRRIADHEGFDVGDFHVLSSSTISAPFQPVMIEAALVLPEIFSGKIEASMMRRPARPWTRRRGIDDGGRGSGPMRQVETG